MAWICLFIAGLLEVTWATCLKLSEGFTRLNWSVVTVIGIIASFVFLSHSFEYLHIHTLWTPTSH